VEPAPLAPARNGTPARMKAPRALTCESYALFCDEYELTMAQSFWRHDQNNLAAFELSVRHLPPHRGYLVVAGLEQVLAHLASLRFDSTALEYLAGTGTYERGFIDYLGTLRFTGRVDAIDEGTIAGADTPLLRITSPRIEATVVESAVLAIVNHQTTIATKAARVVDAAQGRPVWDFSLRRVHGPEAGLGVARAAYIGGVDGTATVVAGERLGILTTGTMAHHFVLLFGPRHEQQAYEQFLRDYPERATLLIDTYDTVRAVDLVVAASRATGVAVTGVRLDSGDITELSREVRRRFDAAGMPDVRILASGDLDEYRIRELLGHGAPVDAFGVGTMLGTSFDAPALGGVLKLVAQEQGGTLQPVMKHSTDKITEPGIHQVFRDDRGDVVALDDESLPGTPLLRAVMAQGRALDAPGLDDIRRRTRAQMQLLPTAVRRFDDPEPWPVRRSDKLQALREQMEAHL